MFRKIAYKTLFMNLGTKIELVVINIEFSSKKLRTQNFETKIIKF